MLQDAEEWLHRNVHFMPDRRHLQFDHDAAQGFDRPGGSHAAIADKGDRLALPLDERAVESVLENGCGPVIVLGDDGHEGVEFADTSASSFRLRLGIDAARISRRRRFVEKRQLNVPEIEHRKPQIPPR